MRRLIIRLIGVSFGVGVALLLFSGVAFGHGSKASMGPGFVTRVHSSNIVFRSRVVFRSSVVFRSHNIVLLRRNVGLVRLSNIREGQGDIREGIRDLRMGNILEGRGDIREGILDHRMSPFGVMRLR